MNFGVKIRLLALGVGLGLMGALMIFIMIFSQQQGAELHARLNQLDSESFSMAEHFKDSLRDVSDKLQRYRLARDEADWREFMNASDGLASWMDQQKPVLNTEHEKDMLRQIDAAYADFRKKAQDFHDQTPPAARRDSVNAALVDPLSTSRRHLFDLGQDLAQAHYDLRNQLNAQRHDHVPVHQRRQGNAEQKQQAEQPPK